MKSLNIDIIFPWEFGIIFLVLGLILIVIGSKQNKKEFDIILPENNFSFLL